MTDDQSRQAATSPDQYTLTIEDAAIRYEHAGHPRTARTIQRYCAKGHLDNLRQETPFGDKYMITPESVARHLAQIEELASATSRDQPRPVATDVARQDSHQASSDNAPTGPDMSRQAAAAEAESSRYVVRLEGEVEFLRGQITTKDLQIKELSERSRETNTPVEVQFTSAGCLNYPCRTPRSRETNVLIGGLQRLLAPLLGSPDPHSPTNVSHTDQSGTAANP